MISPVTSTKVATNGAEEVAGSSFNFFKTNGIIDPDKVPQSTMAIRETETLNPTYAQYWP